MGNVLGIRARAKSASMAWSGKVSKSLCMRRLQFQRFMVVLPKGGERRIDIKNMVDSSGMVPSTQPQ